MTKIGFIFPGQGSQTVGMCKDLYQDYPAARQIFDMAGEVTGINITDLCFNGPLETLTLTENLQPALTAVNLACLAALNTDFDAKPCACAGHSLGEYAALAASGAISAEDAICLTHKRGALMQREADQNPGKMSAVLKLPMDLVQKIVDEVAIDGILAVANHNSADQIVITGTPDRIKAAAKKIRGHKGICVPLKVSGAWHSPLIQGAQEEFGTFLDTISFKSPDLPVVFNVTAETESNPKDIRTVMAKQFCSPVRWHDSILKMSDMGVDTFVEIGPGKVLSGLLKKNLSPEFNTKSYNINSVETLNAFLDQEG